MDTTPQMKRERMREQNFCKKIALPVFVISISFNALFFYIHIQYPISLKNAIRDVKEALYRKDPYLCPVFRGGLGNMMFQYASVYGIAKRKGMNVGLSSHSVLYRLFNISTAPITDDEICKKAKITYEYHPCGFDAETINFDSTRNRKHSSYLQSWKYFENVEDDIRQQFKFRRSISDRADYLIRKVVGKIDFNDTNTNLTIIGVHVRRGDILDPNKIEYGYNVADKEFITNALNYYRNKFNNTLFLVFTNPNVNDTEWCTSNINGSDVLLMHSNAREVDMCIISKCNHTIMTVGSFGWWASWINRGETIYFKNAARENSSLREDFNEGMTDYYYPGWIGM